MFEACAMVALRCRRAIASLVPNMFESAPAPKSGIYAIQNDIAERLEGLHKAALADAVVANECCQPTKLDLTAVANGLEVLDTKGPQRWMLHRINPRSTSR